MLALLITFCITGLSSHTFKYGAQIDNLERFPHPQSCVILHSECSVVIAGTQNILEIQLYTCTLVKTHIAQGSIKLFIYFSNNVHNKRNLKFWGPFELRFYNCELLRFQEQFWPSGDCTRIVAFVSSYIWNSKATELCWESAQGKAFISGMWHGRTAGLLQH